MEKKKVLIGITGGIAAYKVHEIIRELIKQDIDVTVVATESALKFVTTSTLSALTGKKVLTDMFLSDGDITHIELANDVDAIAVIPATANTIAKIAYGIADNLLTNIILASKKPIIIAPSMNVNMWENSITKENIEKIKKRGIIVIEPEVGELACKTTGAGRLAEKDVIISQIIQTLTPQNLKKKKILITAGPTREMIDDVRFISNPSTGKMGYALAKAAWERGGDVLLISGPTQLMNIPMIRTINVTSASEMHKEVLENYSDYDVIIKNAAVSDITPEKKNAGKIKKSDIPEAIKVKQSIDILAEIGKKRTNKDQIIVGFAVQTDDLEKNAKEKLRVKNCDYIVANLASDGFEKDTNKVVIFFKDGRKKEISTRSKYQLANAILDEIV